MQASRILRRLGSITRYQHCPYLRYLNNYNMIQLNHNTWHVSEHDITDCIKLAVFDFSGTTTGSGVISVVEAMITTFKTMGITITEEEARLPMGKHKKVHIGLICEMQSVKDKWHTVHNKYPDNLDVNVLFDHFQPIQLDMIDRYETIIPGTIEALTEIKSMNIDRGSSTGFTREMVNRILEKNKELIDVMPYTCAANEVNKARPYPFMIHKNMEHYGIENPHNVVKIDDTEDGMREGFNAGTWTIGVIDHSSNMGLSYNEIIDLKIRFPKEYEEIYQRNKHKMKVAGAQFVVPDITYVPDTIRKINNIIFFENMIRKHIFN